jgi:hypothetical protein
VAFQNVAGGTRSRPGGLRLQYGEPVAQFTRPPVRPLPPQLHQAFLESLRRLVRAHVRCPAVLPNPRPALRFIPGHPLLAGFPANPVLPAQLGNRPLVFEILSHKLHPFIHRTGLFPGHRPFLLALLCTCHLCSRSICYLCTKSVPPLPLPRRGEREGGVRGLRSHQFFHAISGTLHWTPTHLLSYRYGAIGQGKRDSLT